MSEQTSHHHRKEFFRWWWGDLWKGKNGKMMGTKQLSVDALELAFVRRCADADDYALSQSHFGRAAVVRATSSAIVVSEPNAAWLALLCGIALTARRRWAWMAVCGLVLSLVPLPAFAVNNVGGTLITLTSSPTAPNGAWSWFEDERAVIDDSDPDNTLLLVSSVSSAPNGNPERGDVDLLWLNIDTGQQGEFELHDQFEADDHNSAALLIRPDGRYLAVYAKHNTDQYTRWRISTNPGDPTSWGPVHTIDNGAGATYSNLHYLPADNGGTGRLYNFLRSIGFDPNVLVSDDGGNSFSYAGKLLTEGGSGDRPYLRYFSNGEEIHFIATERHPRNYDNSIYHGYVKNGQLFDSIGSLLDGSLFDNAAVAPAALTPVFGTGTQFGGTTMRRAWTLDVAIDDSGLPYALFQARANDRNTDHRFFYGKFDGVNWNVHEVAKAGGFLYAAEDDYTGNGALDPSNPNRLFISTKIDPRTQIEMAHYEIFEGLTADGGANWEWAPITFNSTVDNLRPLVPKWSADETALVWMRGVYSTYTSWDTEIVALTDIVPLSASSLADLNGDGTVDAADFVQYIAGLHVDLSGLTVEGARQMGDLNGDFRNDFLDYQIFRREYDLAHGQGALAATIVSVPEPDYLWLIALTAIGFQHMRR